MGEHVVEVRPLCGPKVLWLTAEGVSVRVLQFCLGVRDGEGECGLWYAKNSCFFFVLFCFGN